MAEEQRPPERITPEVNIDAALGKLNLSVREDQQLNEKQREGLEHAIGMIRDLNKNNGFSCTVMPLHAELEGGRVLNGMNKVHITAVERGRHSPNKASLILKYKDVNDKNPDICLIYEQGSPKLNLRYEIDK